MYDREIKERVTTLKEQFLRVSAPPGADPAVLAEARIAADNVAALAAGVLMNLRDVAEALRGIQETLENRRDWTH